MPVLELFRVTGLDPFHPDRIAAILKRLKADPPPTLGFAEPAGDTDAWLLPLLNEKKFLTLLAEKMTGDDQALIKARIQQISQK